MNNSTWVIQMMMQSYDDNSDSSCCNNLWNGKEQTTRAKSPLPGYDAELAKEMNELSFQEREKVFDDIHGVATVTEETPEFIADCIKALDESIAKLSAKVTKNLKRAYFLRPGLETDRSFKLMFLRADEYNATNAAKRMVKFFDSKLELFGEEKLAKRITIDDLSDDDLYVFLSGYTLELPTPDQTGRPIIYGDTSKVDFRRMSVENVLRAQFYMHTKAVADKEIAQKKGAFSLAYCPGSLLSIGRGTDYAFRSGNLLSGLPFRYSSLHFCYDDPHMQFLIQAMRRAIGKTARLRFRAHYGTELENEYNLMTFGVPCDQLLHRSAAGDTTAHQAYVQGRREIDRQQDELEAQQEAESGIIAHPAPRDVLIGRGNAYRDYVGNSLWNRLISENLDRYMTSDSSFAKTCVTIDILKQVREQGGRFLQRTDAGWVVLDDADAREKAAIAFRNRAKSPAVTSGADHNARQVTARYRKGGTTFLQEHESKRVRLMA